MLPVVVLCGGLGTRLRSVVADRPKVLAPIEGRPYLGYLFDHLQREGVTDVVLATGYLGEQVDAFAAEHAPDSMRVRCVQENEPLGTGGALARAVREAGIRGRFLALNGDTFFGGSLRRLVESAPADATATLALVRVPDAQRYGRVRFDDGTGRIDRFEEKGGAAGSAWINAGAYALTTDAVEGMERGSLEREVFTELVKAGRLAACPFPDAPFLDIGTPDDFARAPAALDRIRRARW
jgi:NDP-sugar pyrophosphorylase family protein